MNKQQLFENIKKKQSFLCVGLDTDIKRSRNIYCRKKILFSHSIKRSSTLPPIIVSLTSRIWLLREPRHKGMMAFEKTVAYLRENYPDQFIIADAKRGDIGNTSEMYARSFFDHIKVDAVTVAPYMGEDSVKPFLIYPEAWVILLALTSNKGSHDFK